MKIFSPPRPFSRVDTSQRQRNCAVLLVNRWFLTAAVLAGLGAGCSGPTLPVTVTAADGSGDASLADAAGDQYAGDQLAADGKVDTAAVDTTVIALCKVDTDCPATSVQCFTPFCDVGVCNIKPVVGSQTCNDGNKCTESDVCSAGKCLGAAKDCNDGNPCTADLCAPASGCMYNNLEIPCKDNDICVLHACQAGACVVVEANPCDDSNPCTTDSCDPKVGCKYKSLTAIPCDDNDTCTKYDVCKFGQCIGKGKSCSDDNPCTDDGCDSAGTCSNVPNAKPCSDGKACTVGDSCQSGTCGGKPKDCEDGSPCTVNLCDNLTGGCVVTLPEGSTPCDDGNACTTGDACSGYICQAGTAKACDDGNDCTVDACDVASGTCSNLPASDGVNCSAQNLCLAEPKCLAGQCVGDAKVCDDSNPCTQDLCDPSSGLCTQANAADGTSCGEAATCQSGVCL